MKNTEEQIKVILNTYAVGQPVKSFEIYKAIKRVDPEFTDDERSYTNIRKIIAKLEDEAHSEIEPVKCIGSTVEGFLICTDREQAFMSAKHLLSKFVSTAIRYQRRKVVMNKLFPKDEFSTPLFQEFDPLPEWDLEKLIDLEKNIKSKGGG